jgi:hypothetical protein
LQMSTLSLLVVPEESMFMTLLKNYGSPNSHICHTIDTPHLHNWELCNHWKFFPYAIKWHEILSP